MIFTHTDARHDAPAETVSEITPRSTRRLLAWPARAVIGVGPLLLAWILLGDQIYGWLGVAALLVVLVTLLRGSAADSVSSWANSSAPSASRRSR